MVRNFTGECKQYLLDLVSEDGNEQIGTVSENFGDLLSSTASSLGFTSLEGYANDMEGYFNGVVEKNNTASTDIENLFNNVYLTDSTCYNKLLAVKGILDTYKSSVELLSETIDPANNSFNMPSIAAVGTKIDVNNLVNSKLMVQAKDGLSDDDITGMDPDALQLLIETTIGAYLLTHKVEVGEKIEIPLTPNITVFYEVKVEGEPNEDGLVDIEATIKDQQAEISSVSTKIPLNDMLSVSADSDGKLTLEADNDGTGGSISVDGNGVSASASVQTGDINWKTEIGTDGFTVSGSVTEGVNTFTVSASTTLTSETVKESVSTKVDNVTVTTTAGIEIHNAWQPQEETVTQPESQPATQYVPSPVTTADEDTVTAPQVTTTTPTSDSGWLHIDPPSAETVETVAVVAVVCIVAIAAIALIPETGGASLGLFAFI